MFPQLFWCSAPISSPDASILFYNLRWEAHKRWIAEYSLRRRPQKPHQSVGGLQVYCTFHVYKYAGCTLHVYVLTLRSWINSASGRANIFQQVGPHRQIPYFQITLAGRELIQELALSPLYWLMPDWNLDSQAMSGSCVKSFWTKMFWVMWNVQNDWDQQSIIQSDEGRQCECKRIMVRLAHPSCLIRCIPQVCQGATGVAPFPQPDQSLPHLLYYQALP